MAGGRYHPEYDYDEDRPVRLHMGVWATLGIGSLVILAILGITIATLVIVDDTKSEVDKIRHSSRHSSSSGHDREERECPAVSCLQPFGPCTKRLPELLDDFPCCVTVFEDKLVKKVPVKPKHRKYHEDDDYDSPDSRWKYGYVDESYSHGTGKMKMKHDSWYEMDDGYFVQDSDGYFEVYGEPFKKSVGPSQYGPGTGLLDTVKFAISPAGAFSVAKNSKIVLQAVVKAFTKLPKWHPYEWEGHHDDPRLGYVGPTLWDWDSGVSVGVVFTEKGVWVTYNRMSLKHDRGNWHSAKRVHDNDYDKTWCIRIVYCRKSHTITVYLNDKEVYKLKKIGKLPDDSHRDMFVYRGGEPDEVEPESFYAYLCAGSVLDAKMKKHDDHGLLKLDDYAYVEPSSFTYDMKDNKEDKRLYGMAYKIIVTKFKVDVCEKEEEEKKKPKKEDSHSKDEKKNKHHHHHHHSEDDDGKKKHYYDDEDWEESEDWKQWEFERHENNEEWDKNHKEKLEISNSENWRKWKDDFEHEKSENLQHKKQEKEHYEKNKEWEKAKGKGDDWHNFGESVDFSDEEESERNW